MMRLRICFQGFVKLCPAPAFRDGVAFSADRFRHRFRLCRCRNVDVYQSFRHLHTGTKKSDIGLLTMPKDVSSVEKTALELWPTHFLQDPSRGSQIHETKSQTALIILNSPLEDYSYFHRLYNHSAFTLCADGGANRVYDLLTQHLSDLAWDTALSKALPSLIHGDLDSLSPHVRSSFEKLGVPVTKDPDQYSTDFGKAVNRILEQQPGVRDILVLGSIGGRVDQGIGLLHEFYREQVHRHPELKFWLFSESSVTFLLSPGSTKMHLPVKEGLIMENVGVLPLFGPARISTQGLEWDVEDWLTEMGGQMSTSNHIVRDEVVVETDREVLFTVERKIG